MSDRIYTASELASDHWWYDDYCAKSHRGGRVKWECANFTDDRYKSVKLMRVNSEKGHATQMMVGSEFHMILVKR